MTAHNGVAVTGRTGYTREGGTGDGVIRAVGWCECGWLGPTDDNVTRAALDVAWHEYDTHAGPRPRIPRQRK